MKKILAILLALTMVLGLGVAAFAVEATLTVNVVWAGDEEDPSGRPESLTETAFVGAAGFSLTVSSDNGWTSTQSIDYDPTSDEITCSPATVEGYSDSAAIDGTNVTITYTKSEEEPTPTPSETLPGVVNEHTITIDNTDQNVSHSYEAYQVFAGNLDSKELVLTDIIWGSGVNGDQLLAALKASTDPAFKATVKGPTGEGDLTAGTGENEGKYYDVLGKELTADANIFTNATNAADVAKILATFSSTGQKYDTDGKPTSETGVNDNAGRIDAVATIIAANLSETKVKFTEGTGNNAGKYTADVTGDGYYFIKDTTASTALNNTEDGTSDTVSKYLLAVVKDVTIVAKDTGLTPDKKIVAGSEKVAADSAAIGDTVNFEVTVPIPNTVKYEKHFWFVMDDILPEGITFTGITEVTVGGTKINDYNKAKTGENNPDLRDPDPDNNITGYNSGNGYYTLEIAPKGAEATAFAAPAVTGTGTEKIYAFEAEDYDAVKAAGGQQIKVIFNQFKAFVEENKLTGNVVIKYTGVVNDDAKYGAAANENEVKFEYSNNPNHDYDGDKPDDDSVTGKTPEKKTRSYVTKISLHKVKDDEAKNPLAGATFKLTGTALNRVIITGERYELSTYTAKAKDEQITITDNGETLNAYLTAAETVGSVDYFLLKDGSYTDVNPASVQNRTQYADATGNTKYHIVKYNAVTINAETVDDFRATTDENGNLVFAGLKEGHYTIKEVIAPEGYNLLKEEITLDITWEDPYDVPVAPAEPAADASQDEINAYNTAYTKYQADLAAYNEKKDALIATGGFTVTTDDATKGWELETDGSAYKITIVNKKGTELPSTGGIGTTIFYIVGGLLAVGAGVVLVAKKRMGKEDL